MALVQVFVLISVLCFNFGHNYVLLGQFHKEHPGKCPLEKVILNLPLLNLKRHSLAPGKVIGTTYDNTKDYCNKLSCSVWKNHKGEGYRLENFGCAVITKRPSNCSNYTKQDNRLPWPECCYFHVCPRVRDEL